ncbi:hypothetical protein GW17_00000005 [Ensete ventricosum]|nr:hypothetical protein GW17_00000005 [Ensete ventricosum]
MKRAAHQQHRHQPSDSILAALSVDLLIQILERVDDPRDRKAWRLVCRDFFRAEALHRRALRVLRLEALPGLLRRYAACLDLLDLSACPGLGDHSLAAALFAGSGSWRLKSVSLSRASGVGWRGLAALAAACPCLESVDLSHCVGVGDREAAALAAAEGLRMLRLDKCLRVTDVGLAKLAVGCPALENLRIKWCLEISDIGIELLAKKCQDLRVLDISYLKVTSPPNLSVNFFRKSPTFWDFFPFQITNSSVKSISSLGKLEVLSMVGCSNIDDEGLEFLNNGSSSLRVTMKYLSRCSELMILKLGLCDKISSEGLVHIASNCKNLYELDLYRYG